ncbi:efflux transporter outer membrane subunit [Serratia odorifera]|jgi:NodT family efflux transporter outer membrane factor (OMF) lipoprotein|uniref:Efflux transporter, outer membrane factor lipoprotein, NodT family n=2 Tax=Serratia odorifera TaxID=618 RepID=D4E2I0_SEROD|nr:efflux transporter outer membrane subunit [Serratia odorifera]EFE95942.1 efflux transporter, outer membrane factor lipoprotein, NodT family [Serratia odorifera DSM 4582]PNK90609.1 transporter [Serratia odorifera]RII71642.1 efflux transporter outer membrane subunit [Serratia odorifera]VDZ58881.1 Multidrug resistance outer membrane protein MdtP precursor [Serratia odorifera]HEJ9097620.1 efflux transporter outer membrane subunit [Serratia odorifera]
MRSPFNWRFTPLFAVLLLAGCASTDNIAPQSTLMDTQQLQLAQPKVSSLAISPQWWRSLNDPQLDRLMTQALQSSPSLRQAAARVREAQSVMGEASAANGPNLDLNAGTTRQRIPQNVNMGLGYPHRPIYESSNSLGLNLAYEFDWWGKYRNQVKAAKAQVDAARAEQEQAALTLTSSVASAYYLLQSNYAQEKLLQQEVNNNDRLTQLRQQQYQAGLSGVDVPQQTKAQSDSAKQQILQLQSQIEQLKHQLAALTGHGPNAMQQLRPVSLPADSLLAPKGELTADLLGKRPDIAAQRQLVESYSQRVSAARKEFYPSLTISAFAGLTTTNTSGTSPNLFEAASQAWNIAPALSLPIFHAGALRSKLGEESALYDQAVEGYNQTILNAVQETADAITVQQSTAQQLQQAASASQSMQQVYRVANARYQAGIIGRDELLSSQTQLIQQQQAEVVASSNMMQAKIGLIRALGGGYQAPTNADSKA